MRSIFDKVHTYVSVNECILSENGVIECFMCAILYARRPWQQLIYNQTARNKSFLRTTFYLGK